MLDPMKTVSKAVWMLAAILPGILCLSSETRAQETGTVVVREVKGEVRVIRSGQEFPVSTDTTLQDGDVIRTRPGETLDFAMNAVAGARVLPESECVVKKSQPDEMVLSISNGKVMMNLKNLKKSSFRVETPTAIASIRGTQFLSHVESLNAVPRSTFSVRDDAIEVQRIENGRPAGEPVVVEAGFSCDIFMNEIRSTATRPASGIELATMEQAAVVRSC